LHISYISGFVNFKQTLSKNILLDKKHVLAQPLSALCILRSCEPRRATEGAD